MKVELIHACMMTAVIPACESSPRCANDGVCTSMGPFDFTCQCAVGYTGSTCEVNIDYCVSATCPANSMCMDGINAFECTCLPGFGKINGTCVMMIQTESCNAGQCQMICIYSEENLHSRQTVAGSISL